MPSTGFHRPGSLSQPELEALAVEAGAGLARVLCWYGDLLLVHVDGTWEQVRAYRELVAAAVVDALEVEPPAPEKLP